MDNKQHAYYSASNLQQWEWGQGVTEVQHANVWIDQMISNQEYARIFLEWAADANPEVARAMEQVVDLGSEYVEPFVMTGY